MLLVGVVAAGRRLLRRAGITAGPSGSGVPRRGGNSAAQRAQARTGDPAAAGAGARASAGPHTAARQCAATGVDARLRPPRTRQAGRGRHRRARRARGGHVAGLDRSAHPARRVRRDSAATGTRRPTGSTSTTPDRRPGACWWCPARRSPRRCGAPATTSRCRCSATVRGACATRSRSRRRRRSGHSTRCSGCWPPAGRPRDWRIPLPGRVFHMSWCATTSIPDTSRSARPMLVHRAIDGSPGLSKVAQFGEPVGPGTLEGFITDSGLRPRYPAVEIYRVAHGHARKEQNRHRRSWRPVPDRHRRRWPASTAGPRRCCGSTSAAGCSASRRWGRCC